MAVTGGGTVKYRPGSIVTMKVSAAVTEGAFVEVSGNGTVAQAASGAADIVGVALQTASAANDLISVQLTGFVYVMKAKGAVTAGDAVGAASDGSAAVSTVTPANTYAALRAVAGVALVDIADGATGMIYVGR